MKKITLTRIVKGEPVYQTFEVDNENLIIDDYRSTKDGAKIELSKNVRAQLEKASQYARRENLTRDGVPVGVVDVSPGMFAQQILNGAPVDPQSEKIREELLGNLRRSIHSHETKDLVEAYEASISAYISLVRIRMNQKTEEVRRAQIVSSSPGQDVMTEEREVAKKFLSKTEPCFFPGCEELRAQRSEEIALAGGDECPGCKRTGINQKYIDLAIAKYRDQTKS
jgi:hypothetical protein